MLPERRLNAGQDRSGAKSGSLTVHYKARHIGIRQTPGPFLRLYAERTLSPPETQER